MYYNLETYIVVCNKLCQTNLKVGSQSEDVQLRSKTLKKNYLYLFKITFYKYL